MLSSVIRKLSPVKSSGQSVGKYLTYLSQTKTISSDSKISRLCTDDDVAAFERALPKFCEIVKDYTREFDNTLAYAWFEKCMRHNLQEELPKRGYITYVAFKTIAPESELTEENLELVRYICWCNKLTEVTAQLTDDIIDNATKRHNKTCWHLLPEVKNQINNDIVQLALSPLPVLEKLVGNKEYYPKLIKAFNDGGFSLYLGQTLDNLHSREDVTCHTKEKYDKILEMKSCNYAVYKPIQMAYYMCGINDEGLHARAKDICYDLGRVWQMRNDFMDCYSTFSNITCSDAQENKITWLTVNFMEHANVHQRRALQNCYGKPELENVQRVKQLFDEVGMDKLFAIRENETFNTISQKIDKYPLENMKPVFRYFRDRIFLAYKKE